MTIRKSIVVAQPPEVSFRVFCEEIGQWWPRGETFGGQLADLVMERRVGGRFYVLHDDGSQYEIGRVTAYQPPARVAFSWRAPSWSVDTSVEVRFHPEGSGTRVELEHSGWEQAENVRETRKNYDAGWAMIMGRYAARMNAAA